MSALFNSLRSRLYLCNFYIAPTICQLLTQAIQVAEDFQENHVVPHLESMIQDLTRPQLSPRIIFVRYVTTAGVSRTLPLFTRQLRSMDQVPRAEGVPCIQIEGLEDQIEGCVDQIEGDASRNPPLPSSFPAVDSFLRMFDSLPSSSRSEELEEGEILEDEREGEARG